MMVLLSAALFTPLLAGWFTRKFAPNIADFISQKSLYFSIVLIALINMAVFSKISIYFFESPLFVIQMVLTAFLLYGIYGTAGYTLSSVVTNITHRTKKRRNTTNSDPRSIIEWKRTGAIEGFIAMAYVNNILVAVFAEQFFGIDTAILPALYNIPYYIGIIILKKLFLQFDSSHNFQ
jgi:BASS family bile acid:Na+ symporter